MMSHACPKNVIEFAPRMPALDISKANSRRRHNSLK